MSTTPKSRIAIGVDFFTGKSIAAEVTDTTAWPSECATRQAISTLIEIHNKGYTGLRLECCTVTESETMFSRDVNISSPEGHLVDFLFGLAEHGYELPTDLAMGILRHVYLLAGLPEPIPTKDQIFISGMGE
jgi:hypothetical protein